MSRCKCCNKKLEGVELELTKEDGKPEDLCLECLEHTVDEDEMHREILEDLINGED